MDARTWPLDGGRLVTLDALRGVAVMGILLLNIVGFALPSAAYVNPRAFGGWQGADLAVYLANFVLLDGKMRALFSLLFGASMLLVIERAETAGRSPAVVHYARMVWLLIFGLAHLWLIWDGDILSHYALIGMIAFACRHMALERLLVLGIMLVGVNALLFAAFPLGVLAVEQAGAARAEELQLLTESFGVPDPSVIARELALYRGSYAAIFAERLDEGWAMLFAVLLLDGAETLGYFLIGMAALRSGMLQGQWPSARYRRWLLWSWGLALPLSAASAAYTVAQEFDLFSITLGTMGAAALLRTPIAIGWVCLILLLLRPEGELTARLAAVGRVAFTNYLATSLICTTLFYGYGLGWFGHLSRWQLYPVVAAIWLSMLLWSPAWLARFRFGPAEWLWRSLARGRLQPMHQRSANASQ
jgi:uncharacterized protein